MAGWIIRRLDSRHDRSAFDCGVGALNNWLKERAGQYDRRDLARTYIATRSSSDVCCGYYALSTHHVEYAALTEDAAKGLPIVDVPVVLLGRLAVCRSCQGEGLGEYLLIDALRRIASTADTIGIRAVEVDAIHEASKRFYLKYGFRELKDDPRHLFLPMQVIRKLRLG